ncbi:ankyrin repeat and SOCS box protein 2b [Danio rerio]|uniref:Ankyrin repeat and SOCS box protein 2b n=1 Tax=Danio rerio TaxID=7955 RepID=Q6NWY5_DANRE|nr:ankyrin repeat and SOCS box protein 2b [Danio rerio]AAH67369.1 Zgc:77223 [Danio rerio]|eukprot:NP_999890.1 ankyrin repeat and SOCS box-containing protein 2 [Danio rerio]
MTRFSYAEYISLFRTNDKTANPRRQKTHTHRCGGAEARHEPAQAGPSGAEVLDGDDWTPLHEAAYRGQNHCLQALLREGQVCVDKRTLQEETALMLAVQARQLECVRILLEAGADPDICNKSKETPLYRACEQECVQMVEVLLQRGAVVDQRCVRGRSALHAAAERGCVQICVCLLRAGASRDARCAQLNTPAVEAARHGHTHTLELLMQNGAAVDLQTSDGYTPLMEACRHGHTDAVRVLLKHHADTHRASADGLLPLHVASQHGHHRIVSILLPITSRWRLRQSGISPLHLAAERGHLRVLELLIGSGCDVNSRLSDERSAVFADRRVSPLYCAVAAGRTEVAAALLRAGADPELDPFSPLLLAARQACVRTVELLLRSGAHANTHPPTHNTTFPAALLHTHQLEVLRELLEHGCDAHACFTCGTHSHEEDTLAEHTPHAAKITFCEWLCSSRSAPSAGGLVDLLLDYVGNVQLCSRISSLLRDTAQWPSIEEKTSSPRALVHLCRLQIRHQLGTHRLNSIRSLPLPERLQRYLTSRASDTHTHTHTHTHTPLRPGEHHHL